MVSRIALCALMIAVATTNADEPPLNKFGGVTIAAPNGDACKIAAGSPIYVTVNHFDITPGSELFLKVTPYFENGDTYETSTTGVARSDGTFAYSSFTLTKPGRYLLRVWSDDPFAYGDDIDLEITAPAPGLLATAIKNTLTSDLHAPVPKRPATEPLTADQLIGTWRTSWGIIDHYTRLHDDGTCSYPGTAWSDGRWSLTDGVLQVSSAGTSWSVTALAFAGGELRGECVTVYDGVSQVTPVMLYDRRSNR
jgi:hypothetical protein